MQKIPVLLHAKDSSTAACKRPPADEFSAAENQESDVRSRRRGKPQPPDLWPFILYFVLSDIIMFFPVFCTLWYNNVFFPVFCICIRWKTSEPQAIHWQPSPVNEEYTWIEISQCLIATNNVIGCVTKHCTGWTFQSYLNSCCSTVSNALPCVLFLQYLYVKVILIYWRILSETIISIMIAPVANTKIRELISTLTKCLLTMRWICTEYYIQAYMPLITWCLEMYIVQILNELLLFFASW